METALFKGLVSGSDLIVFIKRMSYLFLFLSSLQLDWSPLLSSSSRRVKITDTKKTNSIPAIDFGKELQK